MPSINGTKQGLCSTLAFTLALGAGYMWAAPVARAEAPGDFGRAALMLSGLAQPMGVAPVPGDNSALLLIEKPGRVRLINVTHSPTGQQAWSLRAQPVLDITGITRSEAFRGLTGIAVGPNFAATRHVYLWHNTTLNNADVTALVRYTMRAPTGEPPSEAWTLDPASRTIIWHALAGPYHHGGMIQFGPDGMLYLTKGDEGNFVFQARNIAQPYGKMLRLDVSRDDFPSDPNLNYGIPADNPWANQPGARPELWGIGLRSPWRFTFDRFNGDFYLADVGEDRWEEINFTPAALVNTRKDWGWPNYEGPARGPFGVLTPDPDPATLTAPIVSIPHVQAPGDPFFGIACSIAGGVVYRGTAIRPWRGRYFFAELCSQRVYSLVMSETGQMTGPINMTDLLLGRGTPTPGVPFGTPAAFDQDNAGEIIISDVDGRVYMIVPTGLQPPLADVAGQGQSLQPDGQFTPDDIITYVGWFVSNNPRADCAGPGQAPFVDQRLTADDLIVFINAYFEGR